MSEVKSIGWAMGNPISYINDKWIIDETGEEYWNPDVYKNLECTRCGEKPTEDDHDPCISNLKGVEYACCGHGLTTQDLIDRNMEGSCKQAYIKFDAGNVVRFDTTEELLEYVKKEKLK